MNQARALDTLLVANRSEVALRIMRTAKRMGLRTVAVYSEADRHALHVAYADFARCIGPAPAGASYLNAEAIVDAARATGADAIHPGYGFLAESPAFAERCASAGLTFVGPSPQTMRALGNKAAAKRLVEDAGVAVVPGYHGPDQSDAALRAAARELGLPLMIKAAAGGGGRGMRLVRSEVEFDAALESARSEALAAFGNGDLLLERALLAVRHVEVQIFGDRFGGVVHLGERECSIQRRHQKLIEEAPSPAVGAALRERLTGAAVRVARSAGYEGAGTVEFLVAGDGAFYFIEVNARLQVEHPVTEALTGFDLVEWQLRVARGEPLPHPQEAIAFAGHAIEARLCAEDPSSGFLPQSGGVAYWQPPTGVRVEHALETGTVVTPHYDSLLAKFVAHGATREEARRSLARALDECILLGFATNKRWLRECLGDEVFIAGNATTAFVQERRMPSLDEGDVAARTFALAASVLYARACAGFEEWAGWSTTARPATTFIFGRGPGPRTEVRVLAKTAHAWETVVAGERFACAVAVLPDEPAGRLRMSLDGTWQSIDFAACDSELYLAVEGRTQTFHDRTGEPAASAAAGASDGLLRSPMSGRVLAVLVAESEKVAAGSSVMILEAMKMEHALALPGPAVIRSVRVGAGAQVAPGDVLLAYESSAQEKLVT